MRVHDDECTGLWESAVVPMWSHTHIQPGLDSLRSKPISEEHVFWCAFEDTVEVKANLKVKTTTNDLSSDLSVLLTCERSYWWRSVSDYSTECYGRTSKVYDDSFSSNAFFKLNILMYYVCLNLNQCLASVTHLKPWVLAWSPKNKPGHHLK